MIIGGTATTIEITVMSVPVEAEVEARVAAKDSSTHPPQSSLVQVDRQRGRRLSPTRRADVGARK
jgi:hypothetical protein